jgi:hypothetical protein
MSKLIGIYLITYRPKLTEWRIHYLEDYTEHELNVIYHRAEGYLLEEFSTYREAVDPISAFTRAANNIFNKMEELNDRK